MELYQLSFADVQRKVGGGVGWVGFVTAASIVQKREGEIAKDKTQTLFYFKS